jgi:hypothetical protein
LGYYDGTTFQTLVRHEFRESGSPVRRHIFSGYIYPGADSATLQTTRYIYDTGSETAFSGDGYIVGRLGVGAAPFTSRALYVEYSDIPIRIVATNSSTSSTWGMVDIKREANAAGSGTGIAFSMGDSGGTTIDQEYGYIGCVIDDPTAASEDGSLLFAVTTAGSVRSQSMRLWYDGGFTVGSPTGGSKGAGTINAVAVYDDGTLLTDYVFESDYKLIPIRTMKRFYQRFKHLPTIPGRKEWEKGKFSLGKLVTHLWETVEVQARYIADLEERLSKLEAA